MRQDRSVRDRAHSLRTTFNEAAELYDKARPDYPTEVFDDLGNLGGLQAGDRILEIGCGTGQATVPLAERGYRVVALELGAQLAAIARRNLARFPAVEVVTSGFEDWPLPAEPFDAVVSATAFHWINPAVRVIKSADALRLGGTLATITNYHVAGGTADFFVEVQSCYERWDPSTEPGLRLKSPDQIPIDAGELDASGRFGPAAFRRYAWDLAYSNRQYLDVLLTYSGHLALPQASRDGLLACIASLIDSRYGGAIVKRYLTELRTAERIG
jgi:SAM-dependent methyltransferase